MAIYLNGLRVNIVVDGEPGGPASPLDQIELTDVLATNGAYTGLSRNGLTAGEGLSSFQVAVLKSDGKWWRVDADDDSLSHRLLAMPLENVSTGASGRFLIQGYVRNDAWSWVPGTPLYISSTPGALTSTPPSADGSTARIVAYAASANTIWFDQAGVSVKNGVPTVVGGVQIVVPSSGGEEDPEEPEIDYVIGVRIDEDSSDPTISWIDRDGTVIGSPTSLGWSSFNEHPIIGGIRRCVLTPGTTHPTVTYGSNARGDGLTLTSDTDRVMVKIPKFYVKELWNGNVRSMWISPVPLPGFEVHPAFYQRGGVEVDAIYVSSYDTALAEIGGVEQLISRAGVSCAYDAGGTDDCSKNWFVTKAEAIGDGWGLINAHTWSALQFLWLVEHKTRYSQRARDFGGDIYWYGIADKAGVDFQSDAKNIDTRMDIYGTGIGDETSDPDANPMAWRGIVNLWGHLFTYLDGIEFRSNGRVYLRDASGLNWLDTGVDVPTAEIPAPHEYKGACIKNVAESTANCKYMFIPVGHALSGDTPAPFNMSVYYCDAMVYHKTGAITIPIVKGSKTSGDACGLFRCDMDWLPNEAYPTANGRLEYIGPVETT